MLKILLLNRLIARHPNFSQFIRFLLFLKPQIIYWIFHLSTSHLSQPVAHIFCLFLLPVCLIAHLHHPTLIYPLSEPLSIRLHLPFLYPLSALLSISLHLCLFPFSPSLIFSLPLSPPHVVLLSIPLFSFPLSLPSPLILRSHMVSLSGSLCVWCYPEFTGAPCTYVCVSETEIERRRVCMSAGLWICLPGPVSASASVRGKVQQGSSRLCNSLKFRGRLHLLHSATFSPASLSPLFLFKCCFIPYAAF